MNVFFSLELPLSVNDRTNLSRFFFPFRPYAVNVPLVCRNVYKTRVVNISSTLNYLALAAYFWRIY